MSKWKVAGAAFLGSVYAKMCAGTVTWSLSNWPRFDAACALHRWTVVFLVCIAGLSLRGCGMWSRFCSPPGSIRERIGEVSIILIMLFLTVERLARFRCTMLRLGALHEEGTTCLLHLCCWGFVVTSALAECSVAFNMNGWLLPIPPAVFSMALLFTLVFGVPLAVLQGHGFLSAARKAGQAKQVDDVESQFTPRFGSDLWLRGIAWRMVASIVTTQLQLLWAQCFMWPELALELSAFTSNDPEALAPILISVYGALMLVDYCFNCTASLSLGDVGRMRLREATALIAAREREIREMLEEQWQASASAVAAMLGDMDPADIMSLAKKRFRAVSWDDLTYDIIASGSISHSWSAALFDLSQPVAFGECDAFVSHSWHDNPTAKWEALSAWCEDYRTKEGRSPLLWLDKVCLDQKNIDEDLKCLPVFLAASKTLLVLVGHTYPLRLWCVVELYIFIEMQSLGSEQDAGPTSPGSSQGGSPGGTQTAIKRKMSNLSTCSSSKKGICIEYLAEGADRKVALDWEGFDASNCMCFNPDDKARILHFIHCKFPGGVQGFNIAVRDLLRAPASSSILSLLADGGRWRRRKHSEAAATSPAVPGGTSTTSSIAAATGEAANRVGHQAWPPQTEELPEEGRQLPRRFKL